MAPLVLLFSCNLWIIASMAGSGTCWRGCLILKIVISRSQTSRVGFGSSVFWVIDAYYIHMKRHGNLYHALGFFYNAPSAELGSATWWVNLYHLDKWPVCDYTRAGSLSSTRLMFAPMPWSFSIRFS